MNRSHSYVKMGEIVKSVAVNEAVSRLPWRARESVRLKMGAQEKLPTADKWCLFYHSTEETAIHICMPCAYTLDLWRMVADWIGCPLWKLEPGGLANLHINQAMIINRARLQGKQMGKGIASISLLVLWEIWKRRNHRIFQNKINPSHHIVPPPPSLAVPRSHHAPKRPLPLPPPRCHQGSYPPHPTASRHERRRLHSGCSGVLCFRRRRRRGSGEGGRGRGCPVRGAAARPGGRVAAGSVVAQGCHAAVAALWVHRDHPDTAAYCAPENLDRMHKVTLEVKGETQLKNLAEKLEAAGVRHKLWIEQPENIPTCIATAPCPKSQVASFFRKLKLCK
ncbi:hypothetical protein BRADI_5g20876v3 [Brachypodium distachyon]|uniref:peptidyl-tRNA hydrolase n=1 Tax=Brachypodium distachyon TaxID=15368 RepID=A0A2K2CIF1_BRADI|nr:hypothetical protein BRADI_5g20876v3 [Brachypodium distachyon]